MNYKAIHENKLEVAFHEKIQFRVFTKGMRSMFIYYYGFDVLPR